MLENEFQINFYRDFRTLEQTIVVSKDGKREMSLVLNHEIALTIEDVWKAIDAVYHRKEEENKPPPIPEGSWYTEIDGWHRVRIRRGQISNYEIGAGNTQQQASEQAWGWLRDHRQRDYNKQIKKIFLQHIGVEE